MTEPTDEPRKFIRLWNPTRLTKDSELTSEQKRELPPLDFLGPLTVEDGTWCVPIRDHLGRSWRLCARSWDALKRKLRYFRSTDRQTVMGLLSSIPRALRPDRTILCWARRPNLRCVVCHDVARASPPYGESEELGCATCNVTDREVSEGAALFEPTPKSGQKPKPPKAAAEPVSPKPSLSLAERIAMRRKTS